MQVDFIGPSKQCKAMQSKLAITTKIYGVLHAHAVQCTVHMYESQLNTVVTNRLRQLKNHNAPSKNPKPKPKTHLSVIS